MTQTPAHSPRGIKARFWRLLLRLRYLMSQQHRHGRLVIERGLDFPLVVLPTVFNPALFRTTPFVLECLGRDLVPGGSHVLEIGTGSGVLALAAARSASRVVAVDLNPDAVRCARVNAILNGFESTVEVREGDLFEPVAHEVFDLVLCNPPYYSGVPGTDVERAFYAGDFADRLASGLDAHLRDDGSALIVLSSDGDEEGFLEAFRREGLTVEVVESKDLISEMVTLYRVENRATA